MCVDFRFFSPSQLTGQQVPEEYLNKEFIDSWNKTSFGVNACAAAAYDPFRTALIDNFEQGWEELMKYDWASAISYLMREGPKYPLPVIHWMETRNTGTGGFDRAFAEVSISALFNGLALNSNRPPGHH